MNTIKYVPADAAARAADRSAFLVITVGGGPSATKKTIRAQSPGAADSVALKRGWIRFSALPASERKLYRARS